MMRSAKSCPSAFRTSTATDRLLRLSSSYGGRTCRSGLEVVRVIMPRIGSPPLGSSSLMTSAPQSPSTAAVAGPATHIASSTTLKPDSGPSIGRVSSRPNLVINSPPEKWTGAKFSHERGRRARRTLSRYPGHEDSADARQHASAHREYNGEQRRFGDSLAGVTGVGEVPLMAAANPIDGEPLHAACFLESQPKRRDARAWFSPGNQSLQAPAKCFAIDPECVADILKRQRTSGTPAEDPRPRLIEGRAFAQAPGMVKVLHYVDRIGQHREHQALLARERMRPNQLEELAAQNYIGKGTGVTDGRGGALLKHP